MATLKMIRAKSDAECEQVFKTEVDSIKKAKQLADQMAQKNQEAAMQQKAAEAKQEYEVELKRATAPVDAKVIDVQGKEALLDKKQTHDADKQTVAFKNEIALKAAEILKAQEEAKIGKE